MICNKCGNKINNNEKFCKNCGEALENNDKDKKLVVLSRICLFSLIASIVSLGLALLIDKGFMLIFVLIAYLVQIISYIVLIVKYPKYKYSKLYFILGIIITVIYVAFIIISVIIVGSCMFNFFTLGNEVIENLNSCNIPG